MKAITPHQIKALAAVDKSQDGLVYGFRFPTMENLRRRGLVERFTIVIGRAEYATVDAVEPRPYMRGNKRHEFYLTQDGRDVLLACS